MSNPTPASELEHIWTPLTIGTTTVQHRIMHSATTLLYGDDNVLGDRHIAYYRERARGGCALMITEQQGAHRLSKGSFHAGCTVWERRAIPQLEKLAEAVHAHGAKQFVQLYAAGVHDKGTMMIDEWHALWAASRVPSITHNELPMVMEQEHIDDLVRGHADSAQNVRESGLDGVELHGAHSYLLGQFLSPAYNKRTDRYGGSPERRCRLALDLAEAVRERCGNFTLGIRLSLDEFMGEEGITQAEGEEQVAVLAESGLFDFFHISGGGYHTLHMTVAPMTMPEEFMVPFARRAKEIIGDRAKVFTVCRIKSLHAAERIVSEGDADMVVMTRMQLADPFFVAKMREGREDEVIRCVGSNDCVARAFDNRQVICMMNPVSGRERHWGDGTLTKVRAEVAKRVVVVGAGPAGMKFASVAARRGHSVLVLERHEQVGGHLRLLQQLPTRGDWSIAIDNLLRHMRVYGAELRTSEMATVEGVLGESPDAVVVATGATYDCTGFSAYRPGREAIPGADQSNVIDLHTALERALNDSSSLGGRVVVLDETSGFEAYLLAEVLADAGVDVELVTPHLFPGQELLRHLELGHVFPRLAAKGVRLTAQSFVDRIDEGTAEVAYLWGGDPRVVHDVDTLVLAMYRSPNDTLYHALREQGDRFDVRLIGDALAPRSTAAVIYDGEELGRAI